MGTFNSGSKGGALTLIPVVKSGNGAGKTQSDGSRKPSTNPPGELLVKIMNSAGTFGTWELVK